MYSASNTTGKRSIGSVQQGRRAGIGTLRENILQNMKTFGRTQ